MNLPPYQQGTYAERNTGRACWSCAGLLDHAPFSDCIYPDSHRAKGITIGLVGCASAKLSRPAPARELYTSSLFRKASEYAERECDRWFILSAKHGLVDPDQVLEPYDVKLGVNHRDSPPIHDWAKRVCAQIAEVAGPADTFVILAGEQYRTITYHEFPWRHRVPMQGLGIGEQLAWLTRRNKEAAA